MGGAVAGEDGEDGPGGPGVGQAVLRGRTRRRTVGGGGGGAGAPAGGPGGGAETVRCMAASSPAHMWSASASVGAVGGG